jgi:hypothetical protein
MQSHDLSSSANEQDTMSDVFRQVQDLLIVLDEVDLKMDVQMGVAFKFPLIGVAISNYAP